MSAYRLLNEAQLEILAFQRALKECVLSVDDAYGKSFEEFYVGFEGRLAEFGNVTLDTVNIQLFFPSCSFGAKHLTPRTLSARFLGNLVCIEGIVTKCE